MHSKTRKRVCLARRKLTNAAVLTCRQGKARQCVAWQGKGPQRQKLRPLSISAGPDAKNAAQRLPLGILGNLRGSGPN
jgi:hypothetical protein